jgi:hypothetical protein
MEITVTEQISFTSVPIDLRAVIVPTPRSATVQIAALPLAAAGTEVVRIHTEPRGGGLHQFAHDYRVTVTITPNSGPRYQIGGSVNGMIGLPGSLELQDINAGRLTVAGDGPFFFPTPLPSKASYSARVTVSPPGQSCSVSTGSGTVADADVTNISVTCVNLVPFYTIGGTVTGLAGTLVLQDNNADDLTITADENFVFPTPLRSGAPYSATVTVSPPGQRCTVSDASGTATANVTNISITCVNLVPLYTIGGTVVGLAGTLVLQDNNADTLTITADGSFAFPTPLPSGAPYSATVTAAPPGQSCTISKETGTVAAANVTNISVNCVNVEPLYTIGGTVVGLLGPGLVLALFAENASYELSLDGPASFTFPAGLRDGAGYQVSVSQQPPSQTCTVDHASGTVNHATVTNVQVSCSTDFDFTVSVTANPLVTPTGGTTTLIPTVSGGIGPFLYAWHGYRDDGSPFSDTLSSSTDAQPTAALVFPGSDFYFFVAVTDIGAGGKTHGAYVRVHEADDAVARFTVSPASIHAGVTDVRFDASASTGVVTPVGWTLQYLGNVPRPPDIERYLLLGAQSGNTLASATTDLLILDVPAASFSQPGAYRMLLQVNGNVSTHQTFEYFYVDP